MQSDQPKVWKETLVSVMWMLQVAVLGIIAIMIPASSNIAQAAVNARPRAAPATVSNMNVWRNIPGADVLIMNVTNRYQTHYVRFSLFSGGGSHVPAVVRVSGGATLTSKPKYEWTVPLAPGKSKTVVFLIRHPDGLPYYAAIARLETSNNGSSRYDAKVIAHSN